MEAIRCIECDDVRWTLLGIGKREPGKCEMCGGQMVRERRHPESGAARISKERRDLAKHMASSQAMHPSV